ncbi:hypothetical protein HK102_002060, partial [Quaeritorhiza haematococci]
MAPTHILQFEPFNSAVEATFWLDLSQNKIDVYKLDDSARAVLGYYTTGQSVSVQQQQGHTQHQQQQGNDSHAGNEGDGKSTQSSSSSSGTPAGADGNKSGKVLPAQLCVGAGAFDG